MSKLSKWYGPEQKPNMPGVYITDANERGEDSYQYWTGKYWGLQGHYESFFPYRNKSDEKKSIYQNVRWRGLAKKP